jgi:glycosyltransferase involved in cell wall biosynthesis
MSEPPPEFSIITPSFRPGGWLRLCVASVADQTGVAHEHLVQDAGSDDGTLEWLRADSRVRLFVERDEGMYDAINRGLQRARGELLAYLNCDEQYLPGTLEKVARFFREHPRVEVVFGDAILIGARAEPLSYRRAVKPWRSHVRWVHLNTLTCATFFRRSVVERGFLFDPRWKAIGDAVWVERMLAARVPMAVLPEPLAAFAFTGGNLGASERAARELREWQGGDWRAKAAPVFSLVHRVRKAWAGAYRPREVSVALHTPDAPEAGRREHRATVGYGWPR